MFSGAIIKIIVILALGALILFLGNRMLARAAKGGEDHVKAQAGQETLDAIQKSKDAVDQYNSGGPDADKLRDKFTTD